MRMKRTITQHVPESISLTRVAQGRMEAVQAVDRRMATRIARHTRGRMMLNINQHITGTRTFNPVAEWRMAAAQSVDGTRTTRIARHTQGQGRIIDAQHTPEATERVRESEGKTRRTRSI